MLAAVQKWHQQGLCDWLSCSTWKCLLSDNRSPLPFTRHHVRAMFLIRGGGLVEVKRLVTQLNFMWQQLASWWNCIVPRVDQHRVVLAGRVGMVLVVRHGRNVDREQQGWFWTKSRTRDTAEESNNMSHLYVAWEYVACWDGAEIVLKHSIPRLFIKTKTSSAPLQWQIFSLSESLSNRVYMYQNALCISFLTLNPQGLGHHEGEPWMI